jgi:lipopolysaccharide transport system ATP-binding protein
MYVRLAFAVAAHLEPEILIVDEVLAVGDFEFQKKCLGKMEDVSTKEGRTVLFVSHNMTTIQSLCNSCIVLKNGSIVYNDDAYNGIKYYLNDINTNILSSTKEIKGKILKKVSLFNDDSKNVNQFAMGENISIACYVEKMRETEGLHVGFFLKDENKETISSLSTSMKAPLFKSTDRKNLEKCVFKINKVNLVPGIYSVDVSISDKQGNRLEYLEETAKIEIIPSDFYGSGMQLSKHFGKVFFDGEINIENC